MANRFLADPDPTTAWAKAAVDGKLTAGELVRYAAERHLRDIRDGERRGIYWRPDAAGHALDFLPSVFQVTDGPSAGQPFYPLEWHTFVMGSLFGWRTATDRWRFRSGWLETGKGQAKSPLMGAIGVYIMGWCDIQRAQCYAIGEDKKTANVLFRDAAATELQTAVDDQAKINAAAKLGDGAIIGDIKADPDYTKAFKAHMRRGDNASAEVRAAMQKGTDTDGGYLAPIEWDRTIGEKLKKISPMRAESRVITISVAGFKKYFSDRNVGSGWVGETASRPATTTPQIGVLDFVPGELYANPAISQQLLDDAAIDLEEWLGQEVDTEFSRQEGIGFLSGDGANKPYGILTYVTGAANAARHPYGAIKAVNSGDAGKLTGDGFVDLMYDLPSEFAGNAKLYINRQSLGAARKLKDGQGNFLWQPSYALGQPQTLNGAPIVEMPDMPTAGAGNVAALYGDMEAT